MKRKITFKGTVLFIIIAYGFYIFIMQTFNIIKIKSQISSSYKELQKLKEKNQELRDEIEMSKSDTYIERLAREKLGLIKEGETPVIDKKN